jgi:chromate transporter
VTTSPPATGGRGAALADLAALFLRLGFTAFGGPAAHIALMRREVVDRRAWLSDQEFLDLVGATNLIPGPNSTEMAIHVGHRRAGRPGLFVAGACFIAPAAIITLALAWGYVRFGALPGTRAVLYGITPVVIAIVVQALAGLARTAVKSAWHGLLGLIASVAAACGLDEILLLAAGGAVAIVAWALVRGRRDRGERPPAGAGAAAIGSFLPAAGVPAGLGPASALGTTAGLVAATGSAPVALGTLFAVFLKAGALLFGSGYVLLAFLRTDLVARLGWMTERQLLDAIAVGQVTPGPVFTTATFVGYVLAGGAGALAATLAIFLPAFVFVAVSAPFVPRLRRSAPAAALLDGVNVVSLALMAVVTWRLGLAALVDLPAVGIAAASLAILYATRLNSAWLVLAGAVIGIAAGR